MIEYGKRGELDNFERVLFTLLALLSSIHEALAASAAVAREDKWLEDFRSMRESDPLLRYLWKARDADIHDAIVKWTPEYRELQVRVVDPLKAQFASRQFRLNSTQGEDVERLFNFVYETSSRAEVIEKLKAGVRPKPDLLKEAGVELDFMLQGIALRQFVIKVGGKSVPIPAPTKHQGIELSLGAHLSTAAGLKYYAASMAELQSRFSSTAA